jgi:precorrin-6B methylase 2
METPDDVRRLAGELGNSVWAFAVICSAAETGLLASLREPRRAAEAAAHAGLQVPLAERMLDVLITLGLVQRDGEQYSATPGLLSLLQPPALDFFLADLRSTSLQAADTIVRAKKGTLETGWRYTDPEILKAQGTSSSQGVQMIARHLFPEMEGMEERFREPAVFLDVGTGIGGIAIGMCRAFPNVRVVGLEPGSAPMAEARRNVAEAGLTDRITLRAQRIEENTDAEAFDLVFLPQVFLPGAILPGALGAAWTALRPGGWIMLPAISTLGDDTQSALTRFRNVLWGGETLTPADVARLLDDARFGAVRVLPGPRAGVPHMVIGRRPS